MTLIGMDISIGHPAYKGANAPFRCANTHRATMELVGRGVAPSVARQKVNAALAYPYPHVTCVTADRREVIELKLDSLY